MDSRHRGLEERATDATTVLLNLLAGIITRDNIIVDVSAVGYFRLVDATRALVAHQERRRRHQPDRPDTLRKAVGQHTLDERLAETDRVNASIREILDVQLGDELRNAVFEALPHRPA